jgi:hypothetical protein
VIALLLFAASTASAHPLRFGVMTVHETAPHAYDVRLRFSGAEGSETSAEPVFSRNCASELRARSPFAFGDERAWRVQCDGAMTEAGVTGIGEDGGPESEVWLEVGADRWLLDASRPVVALEGPPSPFVRFFALGVEHIALGVDHLVFVLLLVLLVRGRWPLVGSITGFTLGHSLTLALATLGAISLPSAPVEAAIAASIVVLAAELLRKNDDTVSRRRPALVSTAFGLVHGLGFAGALREVGLPREDLAVALVAFNGGVELGQLAAVALMLGAVALVRRLRVPERFAPIVPYGIGALASIGCALRVEAFF